jgi:hypothetical protein
MENKKSNEEYAKNYPAVKQDGYYGPITVGNIGEYDGRDLINLCVKTAKSGERNAVASFPKSWGKASLFAPGDMVNIVVEDGFIKKLTHAKAKPLSFAAVNREVAEAVEQIQAEKAVTVVMKEVAQSVPADSETPF